MTSSLQSSEFRKYIYILYMSFTGDFKGLLLRLIESNESVENNLASLDTQLRSLISTVGDVSIGILGICNNGGVIVKRVEQTSSGIISEDTKNDTSYAIFDMFNQTLTYITGDDVIIPDIPLEDTLSGNYMTLSDPIIVQLYTDNLQGAITASLYDPLDNLLKSCLIVDRPYNILEDQSGNVPNLGLLLTNIANQSKSHSNRLTRIEKLKTRTQELTSQQNKHISRSITQLL